MKKRYIVFVFILVFIILFFFLWIIFRMDSNNTIPAEESIQTSMEETEEETPFIVVAPYEESLQVPSESETVTVYDKEAGLSLPKGLEDTLIGFVETIYEYSTEERLYYQGTERYLTEEAYRAFAPLQIEPEEEEDDFYETFTMVSRLLATNFYYSAVADEYIELISISDFTFAASDEAIVTQILKLQLVENDGNWLISQVEVIDTIEK